MRASLDMVTEKVIERVTERVTEAEQKLFSLLLEDPDCTYAVLAEKLGVSYKTIFRELNLLKTKISSNELDLIQKIIGKSRIGSKVANGNLHGKCSLLLRDSFKASEFLCFAQTQNISDL